MITQPDPHENLLLIEDRNMDDNSCKRYMKGSFLGKGGFARCYELIDPESNQVEAVKIIQKSSLTKPRSKQKLMSEIKIHKNLMHDNIVKFHRNFEDHANVYIVLQLCTNKTLNDLLKRKRRLTENQIKYYILQVLDAVDYLHNQNIVHRDLKLGNLFLNDSMQIKLGDFGLAAKLQYPGDKRKTICGTPNYIAPEVLEARGHGCEVDIWSIGVICYTLAFGRPPFESKDVKQTYKKIKACSYSFPSQPYISNNLKQVIVSCLQRQPHKRATSKQLKSLQFFVGVNLSRQPSLSFRTQASQSITKQQKQLQLCINSVAEVIMADYTPTMTQYMMFQFQMMTSKQTGRQKSQDKFLATERSIHSINKNISSSNLRRANSQRILKDNNNLNISSNHANHTNHVFNKSPQKSKVNELQENQFVSVKKWIDYSSKYGIGYALSNGSIGVYFNDSSKMLAFSQQFFYYIQKVQKEDTHTRYSFFDYPPELKKKVSLFAHFKGYLNIQQQQENTHSSTIQKQLVYVRRWYRAKHAVVFRLNNKSVQVLFVDQSEIVINSIKKKIMFTSKNKEKSEHMLSEVMQSENRELIKRFQYTKEVLSEMAGQQKQKLS